MAENEPQGATQPDIYEYWCSGGQSGEGHFWTIEDYAAHIDGGAALPETFTDLDCQEHSNAFLTPLTFPQVQQHEKIEALKEVLRRFQDGDMDDLYGPGGKERAQHALSELLKDLLPE